MSYWYKKIKKYAICLILIISVIFCIYMLLKLFLPGLLPFMFALVLSVSLHKNILFIQKKLHVKRNFASFVITAIIVILLFGSISFLATKIVAEAADITNTLDAELILKKFESSGQAFLDIVRSISPSLYKFVLRNMEVLRPYLNQLNVTIVHYLLPRLAEILIDIFSFLPDIFLFCSVFIFAFFYTNCDLEKIYNFLKKNVSINTFNRLKFIKKEILSSLFGLFKANLLLIFLTFAQLFTGFMILHIPYATILAMCIAFIDILPVLGTGTVLIPWGIFLIFTKQAKTGLAILILYAIITVVRQISEPRIIGKSVGLSPLLSLFSMYFGLKVFGVIGIFICPFALILLKKLWQSGLFDTLKSADNFIKK